MVDVITAKTLYQWSCRKVENRTTLENWLDAAILQISAGNGADLMSSTANGMSVTFSNKGFTTSDWANTLAYALNLKDRPTTNKIVGVLI